MRILFEASFFLKSLKYLILDENIIEHKYGDLQWTRSWWYGNTGDAVRVCLYSNVELWIGWRVDQVGKTASCNVTYTPCTLIITNDTKKHMPFLYWQFLFRSSLELKTGLKKQRYELLGRRMKRKMTRRMKRRQVPSREPLNFIYN